MKQYNLTPALLTLAVTLALSNGAVMAQQAETDTKEPVAAQSDSDGLGFERIVVTGTVSRKQTVMQSSVSVSSLTLDDIAVATPRSTAEIFRMLPGVRSEASGTPAGALFGVQPRGKSFKVMAIDIHSFKGGKAVSTHHVQDWARALRQLSAP